jgi:predicted nucleic acid-binding protein
VILVDSSAWIEFLRGTKSTVAVAVRRAVAEGNVATCDVVLLELLCGPGTEAYAEDLERLLARCEPLEQQPHGDVMAAAAIFRACRRAGETPRQPSDCLVAAVAIRHAVPVLQQDKDFEVIARHTELRLAAV